MLNTDKTDVESLAWRPWSRITKYCKEAIMNKVAIAIPHKLLNNKDIGIAVANHINVQQYKDKTTESIGKKNLGALTKPSFLKSSVQCTGSSTPSCS